MWKKDKGDRSKDPARIMALLARSDELWPDIRETEGIAHEETMPTARALGLRWGAGGKIDMQYVAEGLADYGPIWADGCWVRSLSHVILLTGADPDGGMRTDVNPWENWSATESRGSIDWFHGGPGHWEGINGQDLHW